MKSLVAQKSAASAAVRELQLKKERLVEDRDALGRKMASEEILVEKFRTELHEVYVLCSLTRDCVTVHTAFC